MRTDAKTQAIETTATSESLWNSSQSQEPLVHKSYHEMADIPVVEVDALAQLQVNVATLENLQARLSFVMREVRYLLKA